MDWLRVPDSWRNALEPALNSPELRLLCQRLDGEEARGKAIYPPRGQRFAAFELTPLEEVKVVILGQDPYHGPGQAMGLAFSVPRGIKPPPSLKNIFKEREKDCGLPHPLHGDLSAWARRGVLLLNTVLTVEGGRAFSHAGWGWETLTDACLKAVAAKADPAVFVLWGGYAKSKGSLLRQAGARQGCVIESAHPSPLSAHKGFFESRPFSGANERLRELGREPVDWAL